MALTVKNTQESPWSLKGIVNRLEDGVITLSGPALAISGIIAGVDLLTGGSMLKIGWLSFIWAACLMLTLDFQVLVLGARAHQVYQSTEKSGWRKCWEIVLICLIAGAIASISVQMQAVVSKANSTTPALSIDQAAAAIGVSLNWLIWERSALVLVLIFLSGWFKERSSEPVQSGVQVQVSQQGPSMEQMLEQVFIPSVTAAIGQAVNQVNQLNQRLLEETVRQVNQVNHDILERMETMNMRRVETVIERVSVSLIQQTQPVLPVPSEASEPAISTRLSIALPKVRVADLTSVTQFNDLFNQVGEEEVADTGDTGSVGPITEQVPVPEGPVNRPLYQVSEEVNADTGARVQLYISTCLQQGFTPTLGQIMAETGCAKGTAIKYRRQLCNQQEG